MNKKLLFLVLVIFCINILFITKPVHMDDVEVMLTAKQIFKEPFDPFGYEFNLGNSPDVFFNIGTNPPGASYYLAMLMLVSSQEWFLHLGMMIFPIIAGISMFFLGRKFTGSPLLCSLMLVLTPAFMILSTNFMENVPYLAMFLLSLVLFIYGVDRDDKYLLILGVIAANIAMMFRYTGVILVALFGAYAYFEDIKKIIYVPFTIVLPVLWFIQNYLMYGKIHVLTALLQTGVSDLLLNKVMSLFVFISGVFLFPIIFSILVFRDKTIILLLYSIVLGFILALLTSYTAINYIMFSLFFGFGLFFVIYLILLCVNRFRQNKFLVVWFALVVLLILTINYVSASRILLLAPVTILLFLANVKIDKRYIKLVTGLIVIMFVFSLYLSLADFDYASAYKDNSVYPERVYFTGHWGFQYFMLDAGHEELVLGDVEEGSIIVKPELATYAKQIRPDNEKELVLMDSVKVYPRYGVHIMNEISRAGFYHAAAGLMPYVISSDYLERFEIYSYMS